LDRRVAFFQLIEIIAFLLANLNLATYDVEGETENPTPVGLLSAASAVADRRRKQTKRFEGGRFLL